jgi:hypothetical protein
MIGDDGVRLAREGQVDRLFQLNLIRALGGQSFSNRFPLERT